MAAAMLKLLVLSICLNSCLYLGVNYVMYNTIPLEERPMMQNDLFSLLLDNPSNAQNSIDTYVQSVEQGITVNYSYGFAPSGNFSAPPEEETQSTQIGNIISSGIDALKMVMAFIITLWRIAIMPITLFSYNFIPPVVTMLIAIPLLLLNIVCIVIFMRGGGAV